jgi:hypothetical protein
MESSDMSQSMNTPEPRNGPSFPTRSRVGACLEAHSRAGAELPYARVHEILMIGLARCLECPSWVKLGRSVTIRPRSAIWGEAEEAGSKPTLRLEGRLTTGKRPSARRPRTAGYSHKRKLDAFAGPPCAVLESRHLSWLQPPDRHQILEASDFGSVSRSDGRPAPHRPSIPP